ncbi:Ionotropic receptor 75a, partial [Diabrotica virgifera virgifera]
GKQLNKFNHPYRWLIWGKTDRDRFKQFYFRLDGQIFLIDKPEKGIKQTYRVQSIYKISNESLEFMENDVGEWDVRDGFSRYNQLILSTNRSNIMGVNLNISYVVTNNDTFNHLEDFRDRHIDPISKVNWFVMRNLLLLLNGTSTPIFQSTWGYRDGNTSRYTGMVGDLKSGEAEIGGTAAFFTIDRIDIIEYIAPSAPTHIRFLFRAPPLSYVSNVFTLPFDSYVWYCCFGLIPLVFIAVYIIVKWEWYDPVFKETVAETHSNTIMPLRPGFFDVLVMELGAITQQGTDTEPKSVSGRIATVFTFIAFMFLYTAYAANIVAILQSTTESIKTLEDLLHSRISLGVEDIVYAHYYFQTAEEPVRKAIYHQKVAPKGQKANFMDIYEGISKVQKGFFAFHVELSSGYKVIADTFQENEKCGLKTIEFMNMLEPWVSIRKRSAYKEVIKVGLRKILEVGVQRRDVNRFYSNKPVCQNKGSNFGSAGLVDCYAAFLIYGIGIIFSVFLMVIEILVQKRLRKRKSSAQSDVYVSPVEEYAQ